TRVCDALCLAPTTATLEQGRHHPDLKRSDKHRPIGEPKRQRCRRLAVEHGAFAERRGKPGGRALACNAAESGDQPVEGVESGADLTFGHEPLEVEHFENCFNPDDRDLEIPVKTSTLREPELACSLRDDAILLDAGFGDLNLAVAGLP